MKKAEAKIYLLVLDEDGHPDDMLGPFREEKEQEAVEGVLGKYPAVFGEKGSGTIIRMAFRRGRGAASYYTAGWVDRLRKKVQEEIPCNGGWLGWTRSLLPNAALLIST